MPLINLFLSLFSWLLFFVSTKYSSFPIIALLCLENQYFRRYFKRHHIRHPFLPHERFALHSLFLLLPHATSFFSLVSPKTVLYAWKNAVANYWNRSSDARHNPGRPPVSGETRKLIIQLKHDNPSWGCRRIRDELLKLSIHLSHETIRKVIHDSYSSGNLQPTGSWKRFLSSHWHSLFACDFLTVDIFGFKRFYVFFIIQLRTRKIVRYNLTSHPAIPFLRRQFSEFEYEYPGAYLIHDNSGEFRFFPYNGADFKMSNFEIATLKNVVL